MPYTTSNLLTLGSPLLDPLPKLVAGNPSRVAHTLSCFFEYLDKARILREQQAHAELAPPALTKCFLLTTGSETTECALKLARTWGARTGGPRKIGIVSFRQAFHGRTLLRAFQPEGLKRVAVVEVGPKRAQCWAARISSCACVMVSGMINTWWT